MLEVVLFESLEVSKYASSAASDVFSFDQTAEMAFN